MEILVVKLSAIGDVVHSLPAINLLKQRLPMAKITWVVEPLSKDLLEGNPLVDRVIVFEKKLFKTFSASAIKSFFSDLGQTKYDCAIDLQGLFKSAAICRGSGARKIFGFKAAREMAPTLYTNRIDSGDYFAYDRHVVVHNMILANAVADTLSEKKNPLPDDQALIGQAKFPLPHIKESSIQKIEQLFSAQQANSESSKKEGESTSIQTEHSPLVVLIPGTTWVTKLWPMQSWAALGEKLAASGNRIAIIGGKGEAEANANLATSIRNGVADASVFDLTGKTNLTDLVTIFSRSKVVIGGDTGPLHIAAATNQPAIVGVYGSTPIGRNGPFGARCFTVSTSLECQPCFSKTCKIVTLDCLHKLSVDAVFESTIKALPE